MYHLYSSPIEDAIFFYDDQERRLALNFLAIAVYQSNSILLAYALMTNHFHFIIQGDAIVVRTFWECYSRMLKNYFSHHGRAGILKGIQAGYTPINDIRQLRTEIAYVIRNPFVARKDVHVFACPWSSGYLYFNPLLPEDGDPATKLNARERRAFLCSRQVVELDSRIHVKDGCAQAWSFVDYKQAEGYYDNARQFVHSVLKNVEGQMETARKYGEKACLSDDELTPVVFTLCREKFHADSPAKMDLFDRKQLGLILHNEYDASNKQTARLARLTLAQVNEMFPLSAPQRDEEQ